MRIYTTYGDEQLLELLKISDDGAFTEIYNRYWETLFAIGYNFTKDKEMSREVVQDVFMSLWEHRTDNIVNNLGGWLATAIKFSVFKQLQRGRRRQEILEAGTTPALAVQGDDAVHALFLKEYINGAIEKLPEKCQLVFRYSREQGMTIPEIAEHLGVSQKTVDNHLNKALRIIRGTLKDAYIWPLFLLALLVAQ